MCTQPLSAVKSRQGGRERDRERPTTTKRTAEPTPSSPAVVGAETSLAPIILRIHGTATGGSRSVTAASSSHLRDSGGLDSRGGRGGTWEQGLPPADGTPSSALKSRGGAARMDSDDDGSVTSVNSKQRPRKGTAGGGYASYFDRDRDRVGSVGSASSADASLDDREEMGGLGTSALGTVSEGGAFASPTVMEEHTCAVTRLRCARRFHLLLSSSSDGTVRMWTPGETRSRLVLDCATFAQLVGETDGTPGKAEGAASSSSGGGGGGGGGGFDAGKRVRVTNFWTQAGCETVWAACSDHAVRVWSGADGRPLRALRAHEDSVTAIEGLNNQGNVQGSACLVATGSADKTVRVWDVRAKKAQVFTFRGHTDSVLTLRFSEGGGDDAGGDGGGGGEGGKILVSGGKDKTIRIWDMRGGRLRATLEKHFGSVGSVRFVPPGATGAGPGPGLGVGGSTFVSGGRDSIINLWDDSGDCIGAQAGHRGAATFFSDFSYTFNLKSSKPASSRHSTLGSPVMLSSGADNIIKVWDMKRFRAVSEIHVGAGGGPLTKAVWAGAGALVSASGGTIRLWEYASAAAADGATALGGGFDGDGEMGAGAEGFAAGGVAAGSGGGGGGGEWRGKTLASHAQTCTDLISTDTFVASTSKSGQIMCWV